MLTDWLKEEHLECGRALCLQGCAHSLHWSESEKKREKERDIYMQNVVIEFISLLLTMAALKGMTGVLAPFSYLVLYTK
jgi:hypothetical protein